MAEAIHMSIRRWREHPADMVAELFHVERHSTWVARGSPEGVAHQDAWQEQVLEEFPHHPRQAMMACKGPGKTAVLAWLCWNFLITRPPPCKIGATSISGSNLTSGLWAEMARWRNESLLLQAAFEWTAHRIFAKEEPATWFMDFRTWQQSADENSLGQTLAGLWAPNVMNVIDEAGGVPVPILRTAEVVASQFGVAGKDGHILIAGNTTSTSGSLYEAVMNRSHMWKVYSVTADPDDPLRTSRVDIEYARQQIAEYGRENPWVMINILAKFPLQGINTFVTRQEVTAAQMRNPAPNTYQSSPKTLGVDIARYGDDETVFAVRQGVVFHKLYRMRNVETTFGVSHMLEIGEREKCTSIQLDMGNTGAAWYDIAVNAMNASHVLPVNFGGKPRDERRFSNMRAEMLWKLADMIKTGGTLPRDPDIVEGLATQTYSYNGKGQIVVESKDQIKARLGRSPDPEDAMMCTFAHPPSLQRITQSGLPAEIAHLVGDQALHARGTDYDPFARFQAEMENDLRNQR